MKLDDSAIAQIAKILQMAILSGTDIVDHLRQVQLVEDNGSLFLDPEYAEMFEENIESMLQEATEQRTTINLETPNLLTADHFKTDT